MHWPQGRSHHSQADWHTSGQHRCRYTRNTERQPDRRMDRRADRQRWTNEQQVVDSKQTQHSNLIKCANKLSFEARDPSVNHTGKALKCYHDRNRSKLFSSKEDFLLFSSIISAQEQSKPFGSWLVVLVCNGLLVHNLVEGNIQ